MASGAGIFTIFQHGRLVRLRPCRPQQPDTVLAGSRQRACPSLHFFQGFREVTEGVLQRGRKAGASGAVRPQALLSPLVSCALGLST